MQQLTLQLQPPVNYQAYHRPVQIGGQNVNFLHHTYVTVGDNTAPNPVMYNYTCFDFHTPVGQIPGGDALFVGPVLGQPEAAYTLVQNVPFGLIAASTNFPGNQGWWECAGIRYGLNGVCHQAANRILFMAGFPPFPRLAVPGSFISCLIYGSHGRFNFQNTMNDALNIMFAHATIVGKEESSHTNDYNQTFNELYKTVSNAITDKYDAALFDLEFDQKDVKPEYVREQRLLLNLYQQFGRNYDGTITGIDAQQYRNLQIAYTDFFDEKDYLYIQYKSVLDNKLNNELECFKQFKKADEQNVRNFLKRVFTEIGGINFAMLFKQPYDANFTLYPDSYAVDS